MAQRRLLCGSWSWHLQAASSLKHRAIVHCCAASLLTRGGWLVPNCIVLTFACSIARHNEQVLTCAGNLIKEPQLKQCASYPCLRDP